MTGYSRCELMGNLTRDPETKAFDSGSTICTFSLAVNFKAKGEDETSFFNVVAWNKTGELVANYLHKGDPVFVAGRLRQRSYEGKDKTQKTITELVANEVVFIGGRDRSQATSYNSGNSGYSGGGNYASSARSQRQSAPSRGWQPDNSSQTGDDIPF